MSLETEVNEMYENLVTQDSHYGSGNGEMPEDGSPVLDPIQQLKKQKLIQ